jgi:N-terminal domain of toast_rack, DUF2154/Domain of unknown function (DUF5668)
VSNGRPYRRRSVTGALILITLGLIFLYANLRPDFDPWSVFARYWPLLLIFWGIGRIVDYFIFERVDVQGNVVRTGYSGEVFGVLILVVLLFLAFGHTRLAGKLLHEELQVDRGNAASVDVSIDLGAGDLKVSGGTSPGKLMEGTFDYRENEGKPEVVYTPNGKEGSLMISQGESKFHTHWGTGNNKWDVRLNSDVPSNLKIEVGAGRGDLHLAGMNLGRVHLEMGAGRVDADLSGDWKHNVEVDIEGGVGSATIRLPKNIGVEVHASGGIGSIDTNGLSQHDDDYVNDAFGKSPTTMHVTVEGGVGHIRLISAE